MKEKNIEQIVQDAASNVSCETGNLSEEEITHIISYLDDKRNDKSFIYELVKKMKKDGRNVRKTK